MPGRKEGNDGNHPAQPCTNTQGAGDGSVRSMCSVPMSKAPRSSRDSQADSVHVPRSSLLGGWSLKHASGVVVDRTVGADTAALAGAPDEGRVRGHPTTDSHVDVRLGADRLPPPRRPSPDLPGFGHLSLSPEAFLDRSVQTALDTEPQAGEIHAPENEEFVHRFSQLHRRCRGLEQTVLDGDAGVLFTGECKAGALRIPQVLVNSNDDGLWEHVEWTVGFPNTMQDFQRQRSRLLRAPQSGPLISSRKGNLCRGEYVACWAMLGLTDDGNLNTGLVSI